MRKLPALLLLLAACHGSPPSQYPAGGNTPRETSEALLSALRARDVEGILNLMGTDKGPLAKVSKDRKEDLEKRGIILTCYFAHDKYRVLGEDASTTGRRVVRLELTKGDLVRNTSFTLVRGPANKWFVESLDIQAVKDICERGAGPGGSLGTGAART